MMIGNAINSVNIVSLDDMTQLDRYSTQLRALIAVTRRTLPGSRGFGLSGDFIDSNVNEVATDLAIELQEQADIYIPEISVESVDVDYDLMGKLALTINIEGMDGEEL